MARYEEYGLPKLKGTISMTKVKNALKKIDPSIETKISNIRINGQLRGCSGFIINPENGKVAYINTEFILDGKAVLYRKAESTSDYSGGTNRFEAYPDCIDSIIKLIK